MTFDQFTQPTETLSFRPDWSGKPKREIESLWVLNPDQEGVPQVRVTLVTHHDPDGKFFRSSVTWETKEQKDGFGVVCWGSDHKQVLVQREPVARFSKKAIEAAHEVALDLVEEHFDVVQPVFDQAVEKNGLNEPAEA